MTAGPDPVHPVEHLLAEETTCKGLVYIEEYGAVLEKASFKAPLGAADELSAVYKDLVSGGAVEASLAPLRAAPAGGKAGFYAQLPEGLYYAPCIPLLKSRFSGPHTTQ
jgi:hypothetical protein